MNANDATKPTARHKRAANINYKNVEEKKADVPRSIVDFGYMGNPVLTESGYRVLRNL